jgi:hypothetical protein
MNSPDRKSLTRVWEPKPSATPRIPAPAISGASSIPTSPKISSRATPKTTAVTMERRTVASASMRWVARSEISSVSSSAFGVRRRTAPEPLLDPARVQSAQAALDRPAGDPAHDRRHREDEEDLQRDAEQELGRERRGTRIRRLERLLTRPARALAADALDAAFADGGEDGREKRRSHGPGG